MANKQIYELTTRTFDGDSLVPFDTENTDPSTQAEKPYLSSKTRGDSIADFIANEEQYSNDLTTEDKTLTGAINELLVYALNIADEYDPTSTYDVDDFCIYEGVLYKCTTAISTPEAWTSAHWTSTLVVDNFGAGGASVTLGTTVPSDSSGENGDLYVQYEALTYKVVEYFVKINGSWRKSPYSRVVALTQAEYDLIAPDPTTLYIITDAQSSYQTKTDNSLDTDDKTIVGAINEVNSGKADASTTYTKTEINNKLTDYVKIISQYTFPTAVNIGADTEYNSSTPVAINDIPTGYKVIGIANVRAYGYYGSRVSAYAWLNSSTNYHYSIYNGSSRSDLTCQLIVDFICIRNS